MALITKIKQVKTTATTTTIACCTGETVCNKTLPIFLEHARTTGFKVLKTFLLGQHHHHSRAFRQCPC